MGMARGILSREIRLASVTRPILANPVRALLIAGVAIRVCVYLWNRSYWMDEGSLSANIKGKGILDFSSHLQADQLAPFGFLIVQRVVVSLLGTARQVTRLVPLACGIGSLWLFRSLAVRWLAPGSAVVAMVLFAFSDDLVYYASELKPYSSDLAIGLALLVWTARLLDRTEDRRALAAFGVLAVASPWFSFPSVFMAAGCGLVLLIDAARRGHRAVSGWLAGIAVAWVLSAGGAYGASRWMLGPSTSMYVFWNFAFPPVPPMSRADVARIGGILLEVFVNPLNLVPPAAPAMVVILPLLLLVLGSVSLARRRPAVFGALVLPIGLAFLASAVRRYPFHGRLILPLVPAFFLLIAEGTGVIEKRIGQRMCRVVLIVLLTYPCLSTLYEATGKRAREYNTHGDLHDNRFMP